jgi:hypothetical protein
LAQLNVKLDDASFEALKKYSARRRTPVSWLMKDYIAYLIAGGQPVEYAAAEPTGEDLARLAQHGGSFDWLADEPDIYTLDDGEPI